MSYSCKLSSHLYVSDPWVEGFPALPGPVKPDLLQAHRNVQPVFHPTSEGYIVDTAMTEVSVSPEATDTDILAILNEYGFPAEALVLEPGTDPNHATTYHIFASPDVPGATELVPLAM